MTKVRASGTSISLNELEDFNFFVGPSVRMERVELSGGDAPRPQVRRDTPSRISVCTSVKRLKFGAS